MKKIIKKIGQTSLNLLKLILFLLLLSLSLIAIVISIFFENCSHHLFPTTTRRRKYKEGISDVISRI